MLAKAGLLISDCGLSKTSENGFVSPFFLCDNLNKARPAKPLEQEKLILL